MPAEPKAIAATGAYDPGALVPLAACSLIWGTTWFAITWQLGTVPGAVSVVYRFALAAALLFGWLIVTRRPLRLSGAQHLAVLGQGVLTFGINYLCVYAAEERVASAVVAVIFAASSFVNLVLFRVFVGMKAPRAAWCAALLGLAGVAVLSWAELQRAHMDHRALLGLGLAFAGMVVATAGNLATRRVQGMGVETATGAAWAMAYGAGLLALWVTVSGQPWRFSFTPGYLISLAYLAAVGSVAAFLLFFGLARRHGFVLAAYISAVTPVIAMLISALFEHARWGAEAFLGLALVIAGQVILIRAPKAA